MSIITDAKKVYGKAVPDFGDFYGHIEMWDNIFCNRPEWRRVKKSGLYAKGDRLMNALCAAKVLADEFARLTFSEQVTISAAEPYLEYVTAALNDNGFWKRMPEFLSQAYALGGGVVKVYAEDKKPKLNYIAADRFAPTAWDERDVAEGVLESRIRMDGFFTPFLSGTAFRTTAVPRLSTVCTSLPSGTVSASPASCRSFSRTLTKLSHTRPPSLCCGISSQT